MVVCSLISYASLGLVEDDASSSGLIVSHVLYKAAFVIALMRWVLFWAPRLRRRFLSSSSAASASASGQGFNFLETDFDEISCSASSSSSSSTHLIRDCLVQTTFEEIRRRRGSCGGGGCDTCAVCLSQLERRDEVRELRNCCHVFHTECIDRWVEYDDHHHHHHHDHDDNHKTCPLCRTPLLTSSQIQSLSWEQPSQPSWAVERLLYLFGDDLML